MARRARGQMPLIPITTRTIPPWRLLDGDSALRSGEVRRARGAMQSMEFCARHIEGWPHWPGCDCRACRKHIANQQVSEDRP